MRMDLGVSIYVDKSNCDEYEYYSTTLQSCLKDFVFPPMIIKLIMHYITLSFILISYLEWK